MLAISKLLNDVSSYGDSLRFQTKTSTWGVTQGKGPVVVWNITDACNLKCRHCYYAGQNGPALTTQEGKAFIDDLAQFQVPVLLFSGGEPFLRDDLPILLEYAKQQGLRVTLSTNGTLIDKAQAQMLKDIGVGYVGISIDGLRQRNDWFRGSPGAFDQAIAGIRNCQEVGVKVGLRFTINRHNVADLPGIWQLIDKEGIQRICLYHLVYTGRADQADDLSLTQKRVVMDDIFRQVRQYTRPVEVLTVDNHTDGVYLYLKTRQQDPQKGARILELLKHSGGNRSGMAIAAVNHQGLVYPDQFSHTTVLGNIKDSPFSHIWREGSHPLLKDLRQRKKLLKGRCATCVWLDICNGNFRARAAALGDFWDADPACYLTEPEIREDRYGKTS